LKQAYLHKIVSLPRFNKRLIIFVVDVLLIVTALLASFSLRLGEWYWPSGEIFWLVVGAPVVALPLLTYLGLYQIVIRYIGLDALWLAARAVSLYALIWGACLVFFGGDGVPYSVILINWTIVILLIVGSRIIAQWWVLKVLDYAKTIVDTNECKNVVIYGAGEAGAQLATILVYAHGLHPVAFIDDDSSLKDQQIKGLKVYAFDDFNYLIDTLGVAEVLLALPSASHIRRHEIISMLEPYQLHVRTLPDVARIADGRVKIDDLREVNIEDLLGRDSVPPNQKLLKSNIKDKVVMVTGAGGSIGSELCRQIVQLKPKKLVLYEQGEYLLYSIHEELLDLFNNSIDFDLEPILGTVINQDHVEIVCRRFGVDTIYHTAAYKHVPMVELNIAEGVRNNIFGTLHCVQAAIKANVETFVLISTDKAVRPTSTMGATKRFAEMVVQALAIKSSREKKITRFIVVRFGNVLGSSGSVIPLFKKQIRLRKSITVTDPRITRYFMTITEAAQLVIQAGAIGKKGYVFVLNMGKPVHILELAKKMIHLSGLEVKSNERPGGDIEIKFTGLRPGEKLYEELLIDQNVLKTDHPMIMRSKEEVLPIEELRVILDELNSSVEKHDYKKIRELLVKSVLGYKPQCDIKDLLYDEGR
jgi:FlaA1/EpsC-like NDP-sugar epimerase